MEDIRGQFRLLNQSYNIDVVNEDHNIESTYSHDFSHKKLSLLTKKLVYKNYSTLITSNFYLIIIIIRHHILIMFIFKIKKALVLFLKNI